MSESKGNTITIKISYIFTWLSKSSIKKYVLTTADHDGWLKEGN
jgi:hypothetical protein